MENKDFLPEENQQGSQSSSDSWGDWESSGLESEISTQYKATSEPYEVSGKNYSKIASILAISALALFFVFLVMRWILALIPVIGALINYTADFAMFGLIVASLVYGIKAAVKKQHKTGLLLSIIAAVVYIGFQTVLFCFSFLVGFFSALSQFM